MTEDPESAIETCRDLIKTFLHRHQPPGIDVTRW